MPTEYGVGGYDPSKPNNNVVRSTPDPVDVTIGNAAAVRAKAQQALAANAAFIAAAKPGTAATVASAAYDQAKLLTRENNALIRLVLNLLDDVSDV